MPGSDRLREFIQRLYRRRARYTKEELLEVVREIPFAPDEEVFFKDIPEGTYTKRELVDALNAAMERRGRVQAMGGLI